jgi:hypothetical protein
VFLTLLDRRAKRFQATHGWLMQVTVNRAMANVMAEMRISMVAIRKVLAGVFHAMVHVMVEIKTCGVNLQMV